MKLKGFEHGSKVKWDSFCDQLNQFQNETSQTCDLVSWLQISPVEMMTLKILLHLIQSQIYTTGDCHGECDLL